MVKPSLFSYPRGESNPYLKFRKLLFYPLNYKGNFFISERKVSLFCHFRQLNFVIS